MGWAHQTLLHAHISSPAFKACIWVAGLGDTYVESEHQPQELREEREEDLYAIQRLLDSYAESLVCGYFGAGPHAADFSDEQSPAASFVSSSAQFM